MISAVVIAFVIAFVIACVCFTAYINAWARADILEKQKKYDDERLERANARADVAEMKNRQLVRALKVLADAEIGFAKHTLEVLYGKDC